MLCRCIILSFFWGNSDYARGSETEVGFIRLRKQIRLSSAPCVCTYMWTRNMALLKKVKKS